MHANSVCLLFGGISFILSKCLTHFKNKPSISNTQHPNITNHNKHKSNWKWNKIWTKQNKNKQNYWNQFVKVFALHISITYSNLHAKSSLWTVYCISTLQMYHSRWRLQANDVGDTSTNLNKICLQLEGWVKAFAKQISNVFFSI